MCLRNVPQPAGTGLDRTLLSPPIDCDEAKGRAVTRVPLEVVQGRPVGIAAHIDPIAGLALGPAHFGKITATDTDAPAGGFSVSGIGIGDADVEPPRQQIQEWKRL